MGLGIGSKRNFKSQAERCLSVWTFVCLSVCLFLLFFNNTVRGSTLIESAHPGQAP